ncbi:dihydropteroate synthase [Alicyclobacillus tolerans]|uniref:dihydropteroate synthase n=1 Tax=Alicyclobacillus tolerans TaxID=90970 RepID=UPI001F02891E|nr:dihydropteroate synthase [Alicyclobacillus tolerans]MCF8568248.1 dihydropteroate synthase [Alicyclobacillus tolerans]
MQATTPQMRGVLGAPSEKNRTKVMGIVNVTPDSFSDGGKYFDPSAAIAHAYRLIEEGADYLDVGAESTRPGHTPVTPEEEWSRLQPVLSELCKNSPVPVSVDTFKAATAQKSLELGVQVINDIWGGLADSEMLKVVADAGCEYIWMHNRNEPVNLDPFGALVEETKAGIERCLEAGIQPDKLWLDPGIGFGKTYEHNLMVLHRMEEYCGLGYPVLLGTSRKSVIGTTLSATPGERLEGSLATVSLAVWMGVQAVRVHDVQATVRTCRMVEAIRLSGQ